MPFRTYNIKSTKGGKREHFTLLHFQFFIIKIKFYDINELRTPTKKTNPTHKEAPENTTFLLLDQPSGEASTTGTPITKRNEIAINANTAN